MNLTKKRQRTFYQSLVIKLHIENKDVIIKVNANCRNPHWHDSMDKWSREWACITHTSGSTFGVYGLIDEDSGKSIVDGVYVVEYMKYYDFEIEKRRFEDPEIIKIDNKYYK